MKRILIFSLNYYPRFIGGAEVAIKEITDRIDPQDIEFHMVTLRMDRNLPREERIGNVIVHRIGPSRPNPSIADLKKYPLHYLKHWYQVAACFAALSLHRKYRFNGIWAMMAHSCGIPAGMFKTLHPDVPYLLTLQEGDPPEHIERLARPVWLFFTRGFTKADYLQAISTFLLRWGKRLGFHGQGEIIPNGVDTERFARVFSSEEVDTERVRLGKKSGDIFVVTTSRLVHKNAVDDVIAAMPLLPATVHFIIFGIGPDEAKLRSQTEKLGVTDRVHFLGQADHATLPKSLAACDIFIRPSRSEGMGNSFVEAMAAGLPVIATQEGGLSDFIFDSVRNPDKRTTAWAVDADAPDQIAPAVLEIIEDPEKTALVTATAKAMALEAYDWGVLARQMRSLFDRMLEKR